MTTLIKIVFTPVVLLIGLFIGLIVGAFSLIGTTLELIENCFVALWED